MWRMVADAQGPEIANTWEDNKDGKLSLGDGDQHQSELGDFGESLKCFQRGYVPGTLEPLALGSLVTRHWKILVIQCDFAWLANRRINIRGMGTGSGMVK